MDIANGSATRAARCYERARRCDVLAKGGCPRICAIASSSPSSRHSRLRRTLAHTNTENKHRICAMLAPYVYVELECIFCAKNTVDSAGRSARKRLRTHCPGVFVSVSGRGFAVVCIFMCICVFVSLSLSLLRLRTFSYAPRSGTPGNATTYRNFDGKPRGAKCVLLFHDMFFGLVRALNATFIIPIPPIVNIGCRILDDRQKGGQREEERQRKYPLTLRNSITFYEHTM